MRKKLPGIPFEDFNEEVFAEIVTIYAHIAEIKNPLGRVICPKHEIEGIRKELSEDHTYAEWRLGSSLTHHSKLFVLPMIKQGGILYVEFDFDPNTGDDSRQSVVTMRDNFFKEVSEYLKTLENK